jgi:hypothetical protein
MLRSHLLWLAGVLLLAGTLSCGPIAIGNSSNCSPPCTGGRICCMEPNHQPNPDGGISLSSPVCVLPSGLVCPLLP